MSSSDEQPNLAQIAEKILQDSLDNIIHDILIDRHRDHKLLLSSLDSTTKLPHCDRCNLPRLLDPPLTPSVRGAASDPPSDTQYCDRKPWCRKPGFDIYGNPFLKADITGRPPTKKEREAAKHSKKDGDGTPASNEGGDVDGTAPPSPSAEDGLGAGGREKLEKGEKKASKIDEKLRKGEYIPWQTCPNCKRSLLITRFAKHLEQCMGLSGRAASRNAMAKMNGSTPAGSRPGSPGPVGSQENGRENDDEDDEERVKKPAAARKKMLKKGLNSKLQKASLDIKGSSNNITPNGHVKLKSLPSAHPASGSATGNTTLSPVPSSGGGKRDRDEMLFGDEGDDEDTVHVKKRQKLQRVGSTASVASSTATGAPTSAVENEMESVDGSFIDYGSE